MPYIASTAYFILFSASSKALLKMAWRKMNAKIKCSCMPWA